jgi:hypothetical protein
MKRDGLPPLSMALKSGHSGSVTSIHGDRAVKEVPPTERRCTDESRFKAAAP